MPRNKFFQLQLRRLAPDAEAHRDGQERPARRQEDPLRQPEGHDRLLREHLRLQKSDSGSSSLFFILN